jgi:acetate kinase
VDPGILLHLQREHGLTVEELDHALNYSSGPLGISGVSSDLAQIEKAAAQENERARLAFDMFDSSCSKLD